MTEGVQSWLDRRTSTAADWPEQVVREAKHHSVAVILPALNEAQTVGQIVSVIHDELLGDLVDDLVVLDSGSTDATAAIAKSHGARVVALDEVFPGLPPLRGARRWRLGVPSYVYPADILPNVEALGPRVDDIELVLFESQEAANIPAPDAVARLAELGVGDTARERKSLVAQAVRDTAELLGNTPAVARSSYIDPRVIDAYDEGRVVDARRGSGETELCKLLLDSSS